jgi:hypothetical protein
MTQSQANAKRFESQSRKKTPSSLQHKAEPISASQRISDKKLRNCFVMQSALHDSKTLRLCVRCEARPIFELLQDVRKTGRFATQRATRRIGLCESLWLCAVCGDFTDLEINSVICSARRHTAAAAWCELRCTQCWRIGPDYPK